MGTIKVKSSFLKGTVQIPPSKSQAHRAILCAALAQGRSEVGPVSGAKDMEATIKAVEGLGATVERQGDNLIIDGSGMFGVKNAQLDCLESGSTLRFLIPLAAAGGVNAIFTGGGLLPQRPIGAFLDLLPDHGVQCESAGGLPLQISGQLTAGTYRLAGNVSSQYITGLLLALPLLEEDSRIILTTPLESKGYVDMTLDVMRAFGVTIQVTADGYLIQGAQRYQSCHYTVESDWSQAAFFLGAGALNGDITLKGLSIDSMQGDKAVLPLLTKMGAEITVDSEGIRVRKSVLKGIVIEASQIPDLVPVLAVLCAFATGESVICGAQRLRIKESDRIGSTLAGLHAIGARAEETPDGMRIAGSSSGARGTVEGFNDHRIVMAFAVAALAVDGEIMITDRESICKSYPDFFEDYCSLGGKADVISLGNQY